MSARNNIDLIKNIQVSVQRIIAYSAGISCREFNKNYLLQDAIVWNIEIIYETAKEISEEFNPKNDLINWNRLTEMLNKMIQDYSSINYNIVFNTIRNDIPVLNEKIEKILKPKTINLLNTSNNNYYYGEKT
jgi:uncharacterized protein with HEPN domain